uniref:YsnF/AvaK domain-containing protein n=1 Tax=unclassified Sphingomonas TaxID=196159 RepID=UPI002269F9AE
PIVEEEAHVLKRSVDTERVNVRTSSEEEQVIVRDRLYSQQVKITRVAKNEEVAEAPAIRVEGDLTIVPILEERVVVEKRLFLVEELHLQRTYHSEAMEVPMTLRRTRVDVERENLKDQENH